MIDTNALPLIARAAYQMATGLVDMRRGAGNEPAFIHQFADVLKSLCGCASGHRFVTTTTAFEREMDPTLPDWVFAAMPYLSGIHASADLSQQFRESIQTSIHRLPVPEEDVTELLGLLRGAGFAGLSLVDSSLILLGLRFAQDGNSFVITDDGALLEAIQWLRERATVPLGGQVYITQEPTGLLLLEASRSVHACCVLASDAYRYMLTAYDAHLWERQTMETIPLDLLTQRTDAVSKVRSQVHAERAAKMRFSAQEKQTKELDEITEELGRLWLDGE